MTLPADTIDADNPASAPPPDSRSLDRAFVRGVAWTGALRWGTQMVNWTVTLFLARILTPGDYGLFGLATIYIGLLQLVSEFGLGAAIVRRRDLTEGQIASLGGVSIALGVTLCGLTAALAPLVASFFSAPELRWPLTALAVIFVTSAFKVLPKSLLTRDLDFKRVATIDAVEAVTSSLCVLGYALIGWRYWALVGGTLTAGVISTLLALVWRPHRLRLPRRWSEISDPVAFGSHIMVTRLAWYGYNNADNATVGKTLGKSLLGAYSYAWTLASIPVDRVSGLIAQVSPAIFSAVQRDPAALRRYLLKITEGLALLTFPFAIGLACVADLFVVAVLGDRWWPAIEPLAVLAFYAGFRSITTPYPHVMQAVGESARMMRQNLIGLAVMLPLFWLGSHWGLRGVALAWVVGYPAVAVPMLRSVLRVTQLRALDYLDAVRPPLLASIGMAGAVFAVRALLPSPWPAVLQLALAVTAGALTYALIMVGLFRSRLASMRALAREIRR